MTLDEEEVDRRLATLRTSAEAATSNLIELEDLGTLSLLRAGECTGASEGPVNKALEDINALNLHYRCFMSFIEHVEELRSDGRFTRDKSRQIERLLKTASITLPATETEFETRDLFSPIEKVESVTADQLFQLMNDEFVRAKAVILEVDKVWSGLVPVLDRARSRLADIEKTAGELGERLPELRDLERRIDWCTAAIATDPLGAGTDVAANIEPTLDRLGTHVRDVAAARHGLSGQLTVARRELQTIVDAVETSDRARHEARRSIADPEGLLKVDHHYLEDERTGLVPWLARLDDMQSDGRWRDAQAGLRRWTERAQQIITTARRATEANQAPLGRRNELRGMLSAYEAVARRQGVHTDPELARLHQAARGSLFAEPIDLTAAATRVREYQVAVRKREHS